MLPGSSQPNGGLNAQLLLSILANQQQQQQQHQHMSQQGSPLMSLNGLNPLMTNLNVLQLLQQQQQQQQQQHHQQQQQQQQRQVKSEGDNKKIDLVYPNMMNFPLAHAFRNAAAQQSGNPSALLATLAVQKQQELEMQKKAAAAAAAMAPSSSKKDSPSKSRGNTTKDRDARLARNRTTARLRRERKKQEAEMLTKYVAALRLRLKELEVALGCLDEKSKEDALRIIAEHGDPPNACSFCALTFQEKENLEEHLKLNHAAEVKAREQFLIESKSFGLSTTQEALAGPQPALSFNEEETVKLSRLSSEERRKRRLERNAASARLCRQRKKLYIENLRSQLPELRHKVRALEDALPADVVERVKKSSPLPDSLIESEDILSVQIRDTQTAAKIATSVHAVEASIKKMRDEKQKRSPRENGVASPESNPNNSSSDDDEDDEKNHRGVERSGSEEDDEFDEDMNRGGVSQSKKRKLKSQFSQELANKVLKRSTSKDFTGGETSVKVEGQTTNGSSSSSSSLLTKQKSSDSIMSAYSTGGAVDTNTISPSDVLNANIPPLSGWSKSGYRSSGNKGGSKSNKQQQENNSQKPVLTRSASSESAGTKTSSYSSSFMQSPLTTMASFGVAPNLTPFDGALLPVNITIPNSNLAQLTAKLQQPSSQLSTDVNDMVSAVLALKNGQTFSK